MYDQTKPSLSAARSHRATGYVPQTRWGRKCSQGKPHLHPHLRLMARQEQTGRTGMCNDTYQRIRNLQISYFSLMWPPILSTYSGVFKSHCCLAFFLGRALQLNSAPFVSTAKLQPSPQFRNCFVSWLLLKRRVPRKDLEMLWNVNNTCHYSKGVMGEEKLREVKQGGRTCKAQQLCFPSPVTFSSLWLHHQVIPFWLPSDIFVTICELALNYSFQPLLTWWGLLDCLWKWIPSS